MRPQGRRLLLVTGASPLLAVPGWDEVARTEDECEELLAKALDDRRAAPAAPDVLVLDDATHLVGVGSFDDRMEDLYRAAHDGSFVVFASVDIARVNEGYSSFLKPLRSAQNGILLQPDTNDPDVFSLDLPRTDRAAQPPGRGFLVSPLGPQRIHLAS